MHFHEQWKQLSQPPSLKYVNGAINDFSQINVKYIREACICQYPRRLIVFPEKVTQTKKQTEHLFICVAIMSVCTFEPQLTGMTKMSDLIVIRSLSVVALRRYKLSLQPCFIQKSEFLWVCLLHACQIANCPFTCVREWVKGTLNEIWKTLEGEGFRLWHNNKYPSK